MFLWTIQAAREPLCIPASEAPRLGITEVHPWTMRILSKLRFCFGFLFFLGGVVD
jgi:hypothetical protein